ncbi:MAG: LemA family protein [Calditrichia bacterium]|nr:LemA family protein [Calditrichia bacterium]
MKKGWIILIVVIVLIFIAISWISGKYNGFVTLEEGVNQGWAQVENVYQRRADLIPNLVETVKGYAGHEKEVLVGVTEARAKLGGQVNIGSDVLNNPQAFQKFQQMQSGLTQALQRLMVVVERYPELKADQRFADLQKQLEGTENRIAVERRRFNEIVQSYNTTIRKFPDKMFAGMFGFLEKQYFKAQEGADIVPQVKF